jgi:hypothetical protein
MRAEYVRIGVRSSLGSEVTQLIECIPRLLQRVDGCGVANIAETPQGERRLVIRTQSLVSSGKPGRRGSLDTFRLSFTTLKIVSHNQR